jgi:hypothetical protein
VGNQHERPVIAQSYHDMIASYRARTALDAPCLPRHVRQERELRSSSLVIVFAVMSDDRGAGARCHYGRTESDEPFWSFRRNSCPPVPGS